MNHYKKFDLYHSYILISHSLVGGCNEMREHYTTVCFTSCALIDWYSGERTIYRDESRNTCVSAASSGMSIIDTLPKQISPNCLLLRKPRKSTKSLSLLSLSLSLFSLSPVAFTINRYHPGFWYFRAWCYELLYLFNPLPLPSSEESF